jgi:hypothetical protein
MLTRCLRTTQRFKRYIPTLLACLLLGSAAPLLAQTTEPKVSVGGGLRTSFTYDKVSHATGVDQFSLNDARIYISGSANENFSFMFNTDYSSASNEINVLDAVGRFSASPKFNIWAGRFLPPSDRANLYGPFYAHEWGVYTDGIQNGHPFIFQGRDNGVAYWGDFNKIKISAGAFDGGSLPTGSKEVLGAARIQINFWDPESGYYLNGTYYGGKNLLSLGAATQVQDGNTATTIDFLMEKKLPNEGVVSIESEYANYNGLGGYPGFGKKSEGAYLLASYLFPKKIGMGKFELLGKYAIASSRQGANFRQNTAEVNFNYIIKEFNARVMTYFLDKRFNIAAKLDEWQAGVGLQLQIP